MRLILRTITLMAFFLMLSTGGAFGEPVTNGGFGSGLTGWTAKVQDIYGDYYDATPEAISAEGGVAKLRILPFTQNIATIVLSQDITISSPSATISFYVKFSDDGNRSDGISGATPSFFEADFLPGDGSNYQVLAGCDAQGPYDGDLMSIDISSTNGWYHLSANIDYSGSGSLWFYLQDSGDDLYSTVLIDDVVLTENISVPEPSTMLLLAAGLLGLISTGFRFIRR